MKGKACLLVVVGLGCGGATASRGGGERAEQSVEPAPTPQSVASAGPATEEPLPPSTVQAPSLDVSTDCGDVGERPLGDEVSLLDGRLHLRPVQGATIEPRPWNVMGAPEPVTSETRLFLEAGDEKVVVMAYELFALAGDDFVAQIREDAARSFPGTRLEQVAAVDESLRAYQLVPETLDTSREAVFTYGLYVVSPDRTVQMVAFYVNPAAAAGAEQCTTLAMRSARTLRAGERRLELQARTWVLVSGIRDEPLHLPLPAGWTVNTQQGPDFWVHRMRKVMPFGHPGPGGIVYFGGHPSPFAPQGATPSEAPLLGEEVTWQRWTDERGTHAEALRSVGDHWVAHASAYAPDGSVEPLVEAMGRGTIGAP